MLSPSMWEEFAPDGDDDDDDDSELGECGATETDYEVGAEVQADCICIV